MAESILDYIKEEKDLDIKTDSAGTFAMEGSNSANNARIALSALGIEPPKHKSKQISKKQVEWADIILTMESMHKEEVCAMFPDAEEKTFTLKEYANKGEADIDISDPYGGDVNVYTDCANEIKGLLEKIF